jgi:hypothetical protein
VSRERERWKRDGGLDDSGAGQGVEWASLRNTSAGTLGGVEWRRKGRWGADYGISVDKNF